MTRHLISCIVPVYNGERYLAETLASIRAQSHGPLEIIVVDDGSTDRSQEVARDFGARVLAHANQGAPASRNVGIMAASGSFIAFLDADDLWLPHKLERQMLEFEETPDLMACFGSLCNFEGAAPQLNGELDRTRLQPPLPAIITTSMLVRRSAFDRVGLLDGSLRHADSADWLLRARRCGLLMRVIDDILLLRRLHPNSSSARHGEDSRKEFLRLAKANLDKQREAKSEAR